MNNKYIILEHVCYKIFNSYITSHNIIINESTISNVTREEKLKRIRKLYFKIKNQNPNIAKKIEKLNKLIEKNKYSLSAEILNDSILLYTIISDNPQSTEDKIMILGIRILTTAIGKSADAMTSDDN